MTHDLDPTIPSAAQDDAVFRLAVDPHLGLIALTGEFDREHAPQLVGMLPVLAETAHEVWVIDVGGVVYCDAGGLRALAAAATVAGDHGCRLRITRSSRGLQRLLAVVGLTDLLVPPAGPTSG